MVPLDIWHCPINSSGLLCVLPGVADTDVDFACTHSVGAGVKAYVEASICRQLLQIVGVGLIFPPSPSIFLLNVNSDG